jgi:hypothetical protein
MLDQFQLSEKYQFFKVTKSIPKVIIRRCLQEASKGKTGHAVSQDFQVLKSINTKQLFISHIVFRTERPPSFLPYSTERDVKHCYALIIEYDGHLMVSRSGGNNFLHYLEGYIEKISSGVLNAAYMDAKSTIKKVTTQNTSLNKSGVKKSTHEGDHLETDMPIQSAGSKVLNSFKHETAGELFSIIGSQAKVNISNSKVEINTYLARILESILKFTKKLTANPFLENFAKQLPFKHWVGRLTPAEILFSTTELRDYVESKGDSLPLLYYKYGKTKKNLPTTFNEFLDAVDDSFDIISKGRAANRKYIVDNKLDRNLELTIVDNGYTIHGDKFGKIWLEYADGDKDNLQRLINRKNLFSLSFSSADINYANGELCQDSKLLGNIEGFLQMFIARTEMDLITSEKGTVTGGATKFPAGSTFAFVETDFGPKLDHLILDDLEYENADYIGVKHRTKLQLIHCKASKKKFSASAFQEIVGQALKNLHFFIHPELVDTKEAFWNKSYTKSKIPRIRSKKKKVISDLKETMLATNCDKEVYLVVNFISRKLLAENLNKVKTGVKAPKATLPLLWLLSALRNTCLERNVKVYIICKP